VNLHLIGERRDLSDGAWGVLRERFITDEPDLRVIARRPA
jgi:hypothetical protein